MQQRQQALRISRPPLSGFAVRRSAPFAVARQRTWSGKLPEAGQLLLNVTLVWYLADVALGEIC
jgi:hypothetical protein